MREQSNAAQSDGCSSATHYCTWPSPGLWPCMTTILFFCVLLVIAGTLCFASGKPAKKWALWGRSY